MQAISEMRVKALEHLPRVRWLGPDGGWRRGLLLFTTNGCDGYESNVVLNEHSREVVLLLDEEFEYDAPKDDAGNPR